MKRTALQPRKNPQQGRSRQMFEDILEAGTRVLCKHPPGRFNTILVAEEAGISVGSLYQYFPDKSSILFTLQKREWVSTLAELHTILYGSSQPPMARLESMMLHFFETEWKERHLRESLQVACSEYAGTSEFKRLRKTGLDGFKAFVMAEFGLAEEEAAFWGPFLFLTMQAQAEGTTPRLRTREAVQSWAHHSITMLVRYFRANAPIRING
jgi:AcrR family transcriptional regulator